MTGCADTLCCTLRSDKAKVEFMELDLASVASIQSFASTFLGRKTPLNMLGVCVKALSSFSASLPTHAAMPAAANYSKQRWCELVWR